MYARVLLTLQAQQLARTEARLREQLQAVLDASALTPEEQDRACQQALQNAWRRASTEGAGGVSANCHDGAAVELA